MLNPSIHSITLAGQEFEPDSVAGGGKGAGAFDVENRLKLRVSHAMRNFLHHENEIQKHEVGEKDEDKVSIRGRNSDSNRVRDREIEAAIVRRDLESTFVRLEIWTRSLSYSFE